MTSVNRGGEGRGGEGRGGEGECISCDTFISDKS